MNEEQCGCCEGTEILTPRSTANRPGLEALIYRVGAHATFLETMKARLSTLCLGDQPACKKGKGPYPLQSLTTRNANDPAIALLDAWATVADVLTFYQERIANEGYLLTATERRSILELARLVGYRLRPGVTASTYLAFTLEEGHEVKILERTQAQSLPGPGERPQTFETAEPLLARDVWNALKPRLTEPQIMRDISTTVYLQGLQTNLKPNDPLLVIGIEDGQRAPYFRRVHQVELEPAANRTVVALKGGLNLERLRKLLTESPTTPFPVKKVDPPALLSPANEATDVSIEEPLNLEWQGLEPENYSGAVTFDVHFGLGSSPPSVATNYSDSENQFPIDQLIGGRTYYWQITAKDHISQASSELLSFTTEQKRLPTSDAGDVPTDQLFRWIGNAEASYGFAIGTEAPTADTPLPKVADVTGTSYSPSLHPNTPYYWQIITDGSRGEVWEFTTVGGPIPDDGAGDVRTDQLFQWEGDTGERYAFAIGTEDPTVDGNPPLEAKNVTGTSYSPALYPNTRYYWQIIDKDGNPIDGTPWTFTTGGTRHTPITPADWALDVPIELTLEWQSNPIATEYNIYFDIESPPLVKSNSTSPDLEPGTRYYWQVIARGENPAEHPVWEFTTAGLTEADTNRQEAYEAIRNHITNRLLRPTPDPGTTGSDYKPLLDRLADTTLPTIILQQYMDVETPALYRIQEIFQVFAGFEYPVSSLDFSKLDEWITNINSELNDISEQLKLRRLARVTAERIFEGQYIRAEIVDQLIKSIAVETVPGYVKQVAKDIGDSDLDKIFSSELDIITGEPKGDMYKLVEFLEAGYSEDERIAQVKAQTRRVADLKVIFDKLDTSERAGQWLKEKLLALLQNIITDTSGESRVKEAFPRFLDRLQAPPARPPAGPLRLERNLDSIFSASADLTTRLLTTLQPQMKDTFYQAWANSEVEPLLSQQGVQALRVKAAPYGAKFSLREPEYERETDDPDKIVEPAKITAYKLRTLDSVQEKDFKMLTLDAEYDQITEGSWVVIEWPEGTVLPERKRIFIAEQVSTISKPGYGKVTQLILNHEWLKNAGEEDISILRKAVVYAQSEPLTLAEEPIKEEVESQDIRLDALRDGLEAGRWLIVSGERTDIPGTSGVNATELVMLAGVKQVVQQVNIGSREEPKLVDFDTPHTTIQLAQDGLAYKYKRDTVVVYGNVVKATHGETQREILGSGDGSQVRQSFTLKQAPLTHLAAATPKGTQSTLEMRVNDVLWHEVDNLIWLGANDRGYITRTDNEDKTTAIFGDGWRGARLPTGVENIKAIYRTGIGKAGNVAAEKISLLATKPLGVKQVINPLPATGGADREGRDQARHNTPLAVMALDRLVSLQDYEDFARTYAGISKANVTRLSDGRRQVIHLTIAGIDDIPIDKHSDLYNALGQALHKFGDLSLPVQVDMRELMLLMISANVRLLPDYQWESVAPQIRTTLLDSFSFERRQLGQAVLLSQVVSAIQRVPGVAFVDVDILDGIAEDTPREELERLATYWTSVEYKLESCLIVQTARIQTKHIATRNISTVSSIAARYDDISRIQLRRWNEEILNDLATRDPPLPVDSEGEILLPIKTILSLNSRRIRPAQLAYLSPNLPDMLILKEVT